MQYTDRSIRANLGKSHVEIIRSSIKGLSSMSSKSAAAIQNALSESCDQVIVTIIDSRQDLDHLIDRAPDLVFVGMKFLPENQNLGQWDKNKIWVTDILDENNIAYTGSSSIGHKFEQDKTLAKQKVLDAGLSTAPFQIIRQDTLSDISDESMQYPFFVKPTNRGGGLGIDESSVVHNITQLKNKVNALRQNHKVDALVEKYLSGKEFSVAIMRSLETGELRAYPIELIAPTDRNGNCILSKQVKSMDAEKAYVVKESEHKNRICELAINAFKAIGGHAYGRIDIRCSNDGKPYFLEANLVPSLIEDFGSFPKSCKLNIGITHTEMIKNIALLAIQDSIKTLTKEMIA